MRTPAEPVIVSIMIAAIVPAPSEIITSSR